VEDISAMHRVRLSVEENALRDPRQIRPEHYRDMLQQHGRGWVHEQAGEILGFAIADHSRRNIWALFVRPGCERRGIGRALHDAAVTWLFEIGNEPVWLTTEPGTRAERFYQAAGWRRVGTEPSGELRFEVAQEFIQTLRTVGRHTH